MKRLLILSLFAVLPLGARELSNGLGFAAGQLSGIGFSYRYLPQDFGVQVSFGIISLSNNNDEPQEYTGTYSPGTWLPPMEMYPYYSNGRETHANIGVMLIKVLHRAKRSRFYVMTGVCLFHQIETFKEGYFGYRIIDETTYKYGPVGNVKEKTERENTYFGGIGIGMEFKITDNIRLALEWPMSYSSKHDLVMYIPQAGLHYFFK